MEYSWFILGNGRKGYLERTIASWEANLLEKPKHSFIFDDSGKESYVEWLRSKYSNRFTIVAIDRDPAGQAVAMQKIFDTMKNLDTEYFLGIEEDWMLFRPVSISEICNELDKNKNILQMRIPRTIWHSDYHRLDMDAGSLLLHYLKHPKTQFSRFLGKYFQIRNSFYFWAHNPSVFHKKVLQEKYPNTKSHEYDFGIELFKKYPKAAIGFWASNPYEGYVTHIGHRDNDLLKSIPELKRWAFV
jgi:hypothetical protein